MIALRPLAAGSSAITVYAEGKSASAGDEYKTVLVLQREQDIGIIGPAKGELNIADLRALRRSLQLLGLRVLHIQRPRGHRVPMGTLLRHEGAFSWWEVPL